MTDQRYPLHWPQGWPRTLQPVYSRFRTTFSNARSELFEELRRLKASDVTLSTNIPLKTNGEPYANYRLDDKGIAVYFKHRGKPMVLACDKFDKIEDNLYSIAMTIKAIRGIERWGASEMMERAFTGFQALPDPDDWRSTLGHPKTLQEAESAYREMARQAHPDMGGSLDQMQKLNKAITDARAAL